MYVAGRDRRLDGSELMAGPALFAPHPGHVPAEEAPVVAGVQLPEGLRCPHAASPAYWRSREPVTDPARFTAPLAAAFADTGLWPVLFEWESPPEFNWRGGSVSSQDLDIDVEEIMRLEWEQTEWGPLPFSGFPGLAPAQQHDPQAPAGSPFAVSGDYIRREPWNAPIRLVLVPCCRPADVVAAVGWDFSEMPYPVMTAILRSWEDRFGAVPITMDLDNIALSVTRPPQTVEQAERLVAEFAAVCEFDIDLEDGAWLTEAASQLLPGGSHRPSRAPLSPTRWTLSFAEAPSDALLELAETLS
jgi:Domain of unknown function (DUF4253)